MFDANVLRLGDSKGCAEESPKMALLEIVVVAVESSLPS